MKFYGCNTTTIVIYFEILLLNRKMHLVRRNFIHILYTNIYIYRIFLNGHYNWMFIHILLIPINVITVNALLV